MKFIYIQSQGQGLPLTSIVSGTNQIKIMLSFFFGQQHLEGLRRVFVDVSRFLYSGGWQVCISIIIITSLHQCIQTLVFLQESVCSCSVLKKDLSTRTTRHGQLVNYSFNLVVDDVIGWFHHCPSVFFAFSHSKVLSSM